MVLQNSSSKTDETVKISHWGGLFDLFHSNCWTLHLHIQNFSGIEMSMLVRPAYFFTIASHCLDVYPMKVTVGIFLKFQGKGGSRQPKFYFNLIFCLYLH